MDKLGISIEDIRREGFIKRLKELQSVAPSLAERTYVYIPDFPEVFYLFDFNTLEQQYIITEKWDQTHQPVILSDYLKMND